MKWIPKINLNKVDKLSELEVKQSCGWNLQRLIGMHKVLLLCNNWADVKVSTGNATKLSCWTAQMETQNSKAQYGMLHWWCFTTCPPSVDKHWNFYSCQSVFGLSARAADLIFSSVLIESLGVQNTASTSGWNTCIFDICAASVLLQWIPTLPMPCS